MKVSTFASLVLLASSLAAGVASAGPLTRFSLDPASPSLDGNITADDVLSAGPAIYTQGRALGLQDDFLNGGFDNLADFSYGQDPIANPLYFSVDRVAIGLRGSAVFQEALPGVASAAADVFMALPPPGSNTLLIPQSALGLQSGFFGDDIDALELDSTPTPYTYFAIDRLSASNGFGTGTLASELLVSAGNGAFSRYASSAMLGLNPLDAIDGLVLRDQALNAVADPGIDRALFSIDPFSPDSFTSTGLDYLPCVPGHMSPADVCMSDFTGSFSLWASAIDMGLRPDDNLDALDTVPEPGTGYLLAAAAAALLTSRSLLRKRSSPLFTPRGTPLADCS